MYLFFAWILKFCIYPYFFLILKLSIMRLPSPQHNVQSSDCPFHGQICNRQDNVIISICSYCKRGNFRVGVIFAFSRFCLLPENYPHAKIKPICLYEGNTSSIVKITPTWNVSPMFSRNFPPAKITTFTVSDLPFTFIAKLSWLWKCSGITMSRRPYLCLARI